MLVNISGVRFQFERSVIIQILIYVDIVNK